MHVSQISTSSFSEICINLCKSKCCDPWWGIISYTIRKDSGLSSLQGFREEIIQRINERAKRIIDRYVTDEPSPRPLFKSPERYNVAVENIQVKDNSILINLRAMFAFRCLFLSGEKICTIHPSVLGGKDIRPEHCDYLGSSDAKPGERGYCRIIHAAAISSNNASAINIAIETERSASETHYKGGYPSAQEAAEAVIVQIQDYCVKNAPYLLPVERKETPGRNDPCFCGSGKKYKRCHGA